MHKYLRKWHRIRMQLISLEKRPTYQEQPNSWQKAVYTFARSRKLAPKTLQIMKRKLPDQKQAGLFEPNLHQTVHPAHKRFL